MERCARWWAGAITAESQFNRATDALRQPGSSFKPYVYATALMNGFKPTSIVVDSPVCIGNWCPKNYGGGFGGAMTLTEALKRSINVVAVKLSIAIGNGNPKVGRAKIRETRAQGWACARRCPIRPRCRSAPTRSPCSITPPATPCLPISAKRRRRMRCWRCAAARASRSGAGIATARSRCR